MWSHTVQPSVLVRKHMSFLTVCFFFVQLLDGCCSTDRWWKRIGVLIVTVYWINKHSFMILQLRSEGICHASTELWSFWEQPPVMFVLNSTGCWSIFAKTFGQSEKWEHKANLIDTVHWRPLKDTLNQRRLEIHVKSCALRGMDKFPKLCIIMSWFWLLPFVIRLQPVLLYRYLQPMRLGFHPLFFHCWSSTTEVGVGMSVIDGVARTAASSQRGGLQFCFISMSLGAKAHWQQHKMLLV